MLFVPASMPTTEAQNSDYKKYTDDDGRFSIEFPDDWTILSPVEEFPLQQTKRYGDTYPIQRSVGFYDAPLWKTTVQVFEHVHDSPGSNFFQKLKDESATDSEVLEYLAVYHQIECERETFADGARNCVWMKTVDSYIFYTNDNKKVYIVKSAYSIDWWNLNFGQRPMTYISGMIYEENNIWEIMAESTYLSVYDNHEHDDAIIHMIKSFSLEPKSEQPASEPVTAIPEWIKNNAGWWAEGQIDDSSFLQGIQFLIKEGIMVIPPTVASESSGSQEVPAWIKNNAGWWADGTIPDSAFVSGLQWLISNSIITIS